MPKEFRLPSLGENVSEATIGKILVKVGDIIHKGQTVLEIETDKAVAEIPVTFDGKIVEIHVKEGQKVKPGTLVFTLEETTVTTAPEPVSPPIQEKISLAEKIVVPPPLEKPVSMQAPPIPSVSSQRAKSEVPVLASPTVRRLARELGISLEEVPASDPSGKISAEDIMAYHKRKIEEVAVPVPESPTYTSPVKEAYIEEAKAIASDSWGNVVIEPMSTIRKKTAEQMMRSWAIPQVTHFDKANITQLEELREGWAKKIQSAGGRLSVLIFTLKVVAEALKKFPKFNSSIDLENAQIIYKKYYHIGIAVDTENGLLVPVVRDVDKKTIKQLSIEVPQIAEKARQRKLALEELQGATFTISNLGGLGGIGFTPIVNAPQVAILGMSRSSMEPVYQNGNFVPQLMLPLSLSYDHRVIDGADSARFLRWICDALENPWNMFIE